MFITEVVSKGKGGKSYTSVLLRESYRVGSRVKSRTLAVLTRLPARLLGLLRQAVAQPETESLEALAGGSGAPVALRQGKSFGSVWVVDRVARRLGLDKALGTTPAARLAYWQVLARVLRPGISLLAMVRLAGACAAPAVLRWKESFDEDDLYANAPWLVGRQKTIQKRLWREREPAPAGEELFLYDVTSSYLEGEHNALGDWGYNRDGKKGKQQVVVGLLADAQGEPCAVEVYPGNTSDPKTFGAQVHRVREEFGCRGVTMVGDRGMIRSEQQAEARAAGFHFVSALTKPQIEKLLREGTFQMELFEEELSEVAGEEGRRYVLRRNPVRAEELARGRCGKREKMDKLLAKANDYLAAHPRATLARRKRELEGWLKRLKLEGWLALGSRGRKLFLREDAEALAERSRLDGCYVIQTDLEAQRASARTVHDRYKDLAEVERDFRTLKNGHMQFRPWYVQTEESTRAHALTAMLALKVVRHLQRAWASLDLTPEEGLRLLDQWTLSELIDAKTGAPIAQLLPRPGEEQAALLAALELEAPAKVPEAKVSVGTRVKLPERRKTR